MDVFLREAMQTMTTTSRLEPFASCALMHGATSISRATQADWTQTRSALAAALGFGLPLLPRTLPGMAGVVAASPLFGRDSNTGNAGGVVARGGGAGGGGGGVTSVPPPGTLPPPLTSDASAVRLGSCVNLIARAIGDPLLASPLGGAVATELRRAACDSNVHRALKDLQPKAAQRRERIWDIIAAVGGEAFAASSQSAPPTFGHARSAWGAGGDALFNEERLRSKSRAARAGANRLRAPLRSARAAWANASLHVLQTRFREEEIFAVPTSAPGTVAAMQAYLHMRAQVDDGPTWFALASRKHMGHGAAKGAPLFPQLFFLMRAGAWREAHELAASHAAATSAAGNVNTTWGPRSVATAISACEAFFSCSAAGEMRIDAEEEATALICDQSHVDALDNSRGPLAARNPGFPGLAASAVFDSVAASNLMHSRRDGIDGAHVTASGVGGRLNRPALLGTCQRLAGDVNVIDAFKAAGDRWAEYTASSGAGECDVFEAAVACMLAGARGQPRIDAGSGSRGHGVSLGAAVKDVYDWAAHRLWFATLESLFESIETKVNERYGAQKTAVLSALRASVRGTPGMSSSSLADVKPALNYTLESFAADVANVAVEDGWSEPSRAYRYAEMLLLAGEGEQAIAHLVMAGGAELREHHLSDATHYALALSWHGLLRTVPKRAAERGACGDLGGPRPGDPGATALERDAARVAAVAQKGNLLFILDESSGQPRGSAAPIHVFDLALLLEAYSVRAWPSRDGDDALARAAIAARQLDYIALGPHTAARVATAAAIVADAAYDLGGDVDGTSALNALAAHVATLSGPPALHDAVEETRTILRSAAQAASMGGATGSSAGASVVAVLWLAAAESRVDDEAGRESGRRFDDVAAAADAAMHALTTLLPALVPVVDSLSAPPTGSPPAHVLASRRRDLLSLASRALAIADGDGVHAKAERENVMSSAPGRATSAPLARAASLVSALVHAAAAFDAARAAFTQGVGQNDASDWRRVLRALDASALLPSPTSFSAFANGKPSTVTASGDAAAKWSSALLAKEPTLSPLISPVLLLSANAALRLYKAAQASAAPRRIDRSDAVVVECEARVRSLIDGFASFPLAVDARTVSEIIGINSMLSNT